MDAHMQRAEAVRQACIAAALQAYEEAGVSGLCHEGRWAYAVDAMRRLPLRPLVHTLLLTAADEEGGGLPASGARAATGLGARRGWRGHATRVILRRQGVSRSLSCSVSKVNVGGHGHASASHRLASVHAMGSAMERRWSAARPVLTGSKVCYSA